MRVVVARMEHGPTSLCSSPGAFGLSNCTGPYYGDDAAGISSSVWSMKWRRRRVGAVIATAMQIGRSRYAVRPLLAALRRYRAWRSARMRSPTVSPGLSGCK